MPARRRRNAPQTPVAKIDYATGAVELSFPTPLSMGSRSIHIDYAIGPPEPSVIDRIAAIESPALASQVREYDEWVRTGLRFTTFDPVGDPSVPNAFPGLGSTTG